MVNDRVAERAPGASAAGILIVAWGGYQLFAGLYFIFVRPGLLPEDLRAAATTFDEIQAAAPDLESWLQLVFTVLGGQMVAVGMLLIGAGIRVRRGVPIGLIEAGAYAAAGLFSVVLMSGVNFALMSDLRWPLIAPVFLWLSAMIALRGQFHARSSRT